MRALLHKYCPEPEQTGPMQHQYFHSFIFIFIVIRLYAKMNIKYANSGDNNPDSERQCLICYLLGSSLMSDKFVFHLYLYVMYLSVRAGTVLSGQTNQDAWQRYTKLNTRQRYLHETKHMAETKSSVQQSCYQARLKKTGTQICRK